PRTRGDRMGEGGGGAAAARPRLARGRRSAGQSADAARLRLAPARSDARAGSRRAGPRRFPPRGADLPDRGSAFPGSGGGGVSLVEGKRILVVEDEALVAVMLADMLGDLGAIIVGPAGSIDAALPLATGAAVDVAVLDVNLRGERVHPVADALAA